MSEALVQLMPMLFLGGLIAGWTAEAVARAEGYGLIFDMMLGLAGSALAGAGVWLIVVRDAGMISMLLFGCVGGALAIVAQRTLWPSARVAT